MPTYGEHISPHLVSVLGNPGPIRNIRRRVVPLAHGKVLEIGVSPGVNFAYYDPAKVSKVYALEPNQAMIRLAERQRRRTALDVEFLDLPGERIPLEDGAIENRREHLHAGHHPRRGGGRSGDRACLTAGR